MKVVAGLLVFLAIVAEAVIEKTREDQGQRRTHSVVKERTESRHDRHQKGSGVHHSKKNSSSSSTFSRIFGDDKIGDPFKYKNRSIWHHLENLHPPHIHGSIQLGPGVNFQVSGDLGWDFGEDEHWWKGKHVCIRNETHETEEETVDEERGWTILHHRLVVSHTCDDTGTAYKCTTIRSLNGKTTTTIKIHECCAGYKRKEGESGCAEEIEMTDLMSTLKRMNLTEMMHALKLNSMARLLHHGNYTIFAPVNNAFQKYKTEETNSNVVMITPDLVNKVKDMDDTIVAHIVKGIVHTTDVEDEQLIPTELESADIRINKYNIHAKRLMTANCVPMVTKDIPATNGMLHVVEELLQPVTQTIDQLISRNPQLSQLNLVLKNLQMNRRGQYTLFAPTNIAFDKLKPAVKDKIFKGHRCGIDILKQHLLPNVICSSVIEGRAKTKNVLDSYVSLNRELGKFSVENLNVAQADIMGTNGVLHLIDEVLMPENAGDIFNAAVKSGTSHFLQLMEASGIEEKLQSMTNFTMFLPTDEAVKALPADVLESLSKNVDQLEDLINYHIVPRRMKFRDLSNDKQLPTMDGGNNIVVKEYHSFPFSRHSVKTIQCAAIVKADVNSCGDIVHIVSKVLLPPSGDVLHMLEKNSDFSRLITLVKSLNLEELFKQDNSFTFFAPTNKAFESLPADAMKKLTEDPDKATKLLKSHMIADVLCCSGVFEHSFLIASREVNLDGWIVPIEKNANVSFGHVPVVSCDHTATNGVVHGINRFIPAALSRYNITGKSTNRRGFSFDDIWKSFLFD